MNERRAVLVTGANGFIGRHLLTLLLEDLFFKQSYDSIYAIDLCSSEEIGAFCQFSTRILPVQMNIVKLVDRNSMEWHALSLVLKNVQTVIHIAGVVDTRENCPTMRALRSVNVDATSALVEMARQSGVSRFVHLSSASVSMERIEKNKETTVPNYFRLLPSSLFSSMLRSTYGQTKLEGELKVLSNVGSGGMTGCVIRPHVVWGRGDQLSTEVFLSWPSWLPHILMGSPDAPVVSVHAHSVARYVMLADQALQVSPRECSGQVFNIGDSTTTLSDHHRHVVMLQQHKPPHVIFMPHFLTFLMLCLSLFIDWLTGHRKSWQFLRLLTSNNIAYVTKGAVSLPILTEYEKDCARLFALAAGGALSTSSASATTACCETEQAWQSWRCELRAEVNPLDSCMLTDRLLKVVAADRHTLSVPLPPSARLTQPLQLGNNNRQRITLRNRIIKAATFESMCDSDGVPTDQLIRFHQRMVRGPKGAALTLVAYVCVSGDGRSFPTQICLKPQSEDIARRTREQLSKLCEAVHREGALAGVQLTHGGAFADPAVNHGARSVGPSSLFNPLTLKYCRSLRGDSASCRRIAQDFEDAVDLCKAVGFDVVELHLGHGYLLSQYLSRRTNPSAVHGDDVSERLGFPLQVLRAVASRAHSATASTLSGKYMAVLTKFNVTEQAEDDLTLSDARLFARAFLEAGSDLLVPSGGHVMSNGLHMLRGGRPIAAMAAAQLSSVKRFVIQHFGTYLIAPEPYREGFFRERVCSVMLGAGIPLSSVCFIGGAQQPATVEYALQLDGFAAVQMGRALLADPDWLAKVTESSTHCCDNNNSINQCDQSNGCIVGATMALQPLRCQKYSNLDW